MLSILILISVVLIYSSMMLISAYDPFTESLPLHHSFRKNANSADEESELLRNITTYDFSKLFIYGEDTHCISHTQLRYKSAMIGGLYNTGTNALLSLLTQNCFGLSPEKLGMHVPYHRSMSNRIREQVDAFEGFNYQSLYNITKHEAVPSLDQLVEKGIEYDSDYSTDELYIIIIKDPLTWIKSMCKASYYVAFGNTSWKKSDECPMGIHQRDGTQSANQWHAHIFDHIVELYNIYYESWLDGNRTVGIGTKSRNEMISEMAQDILGKGSTAWKVGDRKFYGALSVMMARMMKNKDIEWRIKGHELYSTLQQWFEPVKLPHIVVRFEDVLFRPVGVVDRICECVGGYRRKDQTILNEGASKRHGKSKTRQQAIDSYANETYRFSKYLPDDLQFVRETVNDTILQLFGYDFDPLRQP